MAVCSHSFSEASLSYGTSDQDTPSFETFVKAKLRINDIYLELQKYVTDTLIYVKEINLQNCIDLSEIILQLENYSKKIKEIREVLKRNHMKVAFFGRTSNGKSSVINAMLREKILPNGIGHTTSCFLQVQGTDESEAYLCMEDSEEKRNVRTVRQLGNALCGKTLEESQLVKIFWPRTKCQLLRNDVVFVDSPGIDVTLDLDNWIDKHCLDADVFVLVANSESTLSLAEKNFFRKVSQRLSKPNIFILNNRWDASVSEMEYIEEVRKQHMENSVYFLTKELKVCNQKEAKERIFFVSAKEALDRRIMEERKTSLDRALLSTGFQNRYIEFEDFEKKFKECISKSAVRTKFNQHFERGIFIASEIYRTMEKLYETIQELKTEENRLRSDKLDMLYNTQEKVASATREIKSDVDELIDIIRQSVSKEFMKRIGHIDDIVQKFQSEFDENKLVLKLYKNSLHDHVGSQLECHLKTSLSKLLTKNVELSQNSITQRMIDTIPSYRKSMYTTFLRKSDPFQPIFRFDCRNICADFQEDLRFKFSWGIYTSVFCRMYNLKTMMLSYVLRIPRIVLRPNYHFTDITFDSLSPFNNSSLWPSVIKPSLCAVGRVAGVIFISGYIIKTGGLKLCLPISVTLALLYCYERSNWTNAAKEKRFKEQYINHTKKKLRLIVDLTADNCCHHVQREVMNTFSSHSQLANKVLEDIYNEIERTDTKIKWLDESTTSSKTLKNRAKYLIEQLKMFQECYLNT